MARHVEKLETQIARMAKKLARTRQTKTVVFDSEQNEGKEQLSALFVRAPPASVHKRLSNFNENKLNFKS